MIPRPWWLPRHHRVRFDLQRSNAGDKPIYSVIDETLTGIVLAMKQHQKIRDAAAASLE